MHAGPANGGVAGPTPLRYPSRKSSVKAIIRRLHTFRRRFTKDPTAEWYKNHFQGFRRAELERLYLSSVRSLHMNSIRDNAYYFEFGCWSCNTLGLAWKHFRHHFNFDFVAFDSFEGLPKISTIDEAPIFVDRDMCMSLEEFHAKVGSLGIDRTRLRVVKGYSNDSLTPELQQSLLGESIAVAMIDCDLYESTVPVLEFIRPFVISDDASQDLPREIAALVQPQSGMRRLGTALAGIGRRPRAALDMWRLWEHAVVDGRTLAAALQRCLAACEAHSSHQENPQP